MSSAITNAGEALIALHQNRETGLVVDKFILANIPGVDPATAVDRAEGKPAAENIVYEYAIPEEGKGYINPNQVVYSMLLGSDIGDFEFNWLGLYSSADDTVVAITYCPTLSKWKTAHPTMGNALTRNFMLEYSGLQATTQITVEASTWQIDFTTRQKGIDERERLSNRDIYGEACFFGDGYLIINEEGTFTLQPGTGYVEGIRIDQVAKQDLAPALPAEVFLDVALQPQGSDRIAIAQTVYADPGDYTDGTNDTHYGQKIAEIDAGGVVTDYRPKALGGELGGVVAAKVHNHDIKDVGGQLAGYLFGMTLFNNSTTPTTDLDIAAGGCRDNSDEANIKIVNGLTKRLSNTWTAGDGGGALSSSLTDLAADTWYHVFAIIIAGAADVGIDTDPTGANLKADHKATSVRRIGSVLTDAAATVVPFTQIGDRFLWDTPSSDAVFTPLQDGESGLVTMSTPPGERVAWLGHGLLSNITDCGATISIGSPQQTLNNMTRFSLNDDDTSSGCRFSGDVCSNHLSQISYYMGNKGATITLTTIGWIDQRGRA